MITLLALELFGTMICGFSTSISNLISRNKKKTKRRENELSEKEKFQRKYKLIIAAAAAANQ